MDNDQNGRARQGDAPHNAPPTESGELEKPVQNFPRKIDCDDRAQLARGRPDRYVNRFGRA
jgi:hypothetical protein